MKEELSFGAAMLKRALPSAVFLSCLLVQTSSAVPATVYVQLFPLTGEIRLVNRTATAVPIVFYSIQSDSSALTASPSVWKSISDNYDAPFAPTPGNGFVDPNFAWQKLASTSMQLTEGVFEGPGGSLLPWRPVSLGRVWNPNVTPIPDLEIDIRSHTEMHNVFILQSIDGDYTGEGNVTQQDYNVWRQYYGSTSVLLADGNIDGVVNTADYVVWRNNLGLSIPAAGAVLANGASRGLSPAVAAVPEPGSLLLSLFALGALMVMGRRRTR